MPGKKSSQAEANVQLSQEARWRLLVRKEDFLKDLGNLQRILYKQGTVGNADLDRVANKWGIPRIPWEAIMYCPPSEDPNCTPLLEWHGSRWGPGAFGVSYVPVAAHEVKEGRFLFLMVDLEHTVKNLVPLIKDEIIRLKKSLPRRKKPVKRKHLSRLDKYLAVWDLRQKGLTAEEIAPKLWPTEYEQKGGRDDIGGKSALSQMVYDYKKAAQRLIDSIQPQSAGKRIKK